MVISQEAIVILCGKKKFEFLQPLTDNKIAGKEVTLIARNQVSLGTFGVYHD